MPLQCTAFTEVPRLLGAQALRDIPETEEDCWDILPSHTLCELGEHGNRIEHASVLWYSLDLTRPHLWMARWSIVGGFAVCRFELGTQCLAKTPGVDECVFFTGHPSGHSWEVNDPVMVTLEALPPAQRIRILQRDDEN
ncbi:hypothetical protein ACVNF4_28920 [Streptomyces sp. S6]